MATLGDRIRGLRERANLTQKTLAEKLNIPHQNLSNYERGFRQPDYGTLIKIADYFKVSTDFLLKGEDFNKLAEPKPEYANKNLDNHECKMSKEKALEALEWLLQHEKRKLRDK
ncbi:MAG TPA: helix-turn-helix transcriptional regulator [Bacillus sp. (in: firmicutes)]|uniref:helix-turn-helix domain-containing protein n=1 Tax=Bacillus litorisediminis TaxID=2922713 RepID=UPI001FAD1059|nr:helix-turn-helix transcriptional regulator [Bacillus litorisediminis]HWO77490.1 helix-turn-helix transcriptional regulator [Bacillus sp. (in: firmicutes)]